MSATTQPEDDDATTREMPRVKPEFAGATLGYDGDTPKSELGNSERKAYVENIAIVPPFDKYGEVPKRGSAKYDVYSASGSHYETDPNGECTCMHYIMSKNKDNFEGCKHNQKLIALLNDGAIPAPSSGRQRVTVNEWMETTLYNRIHRIAMRLVELRTARSTASMAENPAFDPDEYDDPIAEATTILEGLTERYEDYRDRVNPDAPQLPAVVHDCPNQA